MFLLIRVSNSTSEFLLTTQSIKLGVRQGHCPNYLRMT